MVKSGLDTARADLTEVAFRNPGVGVEIEVTAFDQLAGRLSHPLRDETHRTAFHQLFVFVSGAATMTVDFVDYPCQAGSVVHVRPGQLLRLPRSPARAVDAVAVLFTPSFPQPLPELQHVLGSRAPVARQTEGRQQRRLLTSLRELQHCYDDISGQTGAADRAVPLVRQVLGLLLLRLALQPGQPEPAADADPVVDLFLAELERSYATTRTAGHYAQRVGYSARTLNRACIAATGHTAKHLIDERVTLEAKRLLVHTSLPASSIAQRLGFDEATNFQKFFVRRSGQTPRAFRAAHSATAAQFTREPDTGTSAVRAS